MQIQTVRILDTYNAQGRTNTDVVVMFEYDGDKWHGDVDFAKSPTGQFDEAFNAYGEVLYIFKHSPEEKQVLEPVLVAAREYYSTVSSHE